MKRVLNISILLISIFMCCTIGYATDNPNSDGYYDFEFRTSRLGQYKIELTATETPFYETLPLDKVPGLYDKFPTSTWTGYTEVDNTEPSARYGTPIPKIKVDVAFATGAMGDQMDAFQNSIAELEAKLRDSRNNLDVKIQYIETVTGGFDAEDADASTIYNFWDQMPNPNNYSLQSGKIVNAVYDWNGFKAIHRGSDGSVFNQLFIESESWDSADFELECNYAWHGCGWSSGFIFHYDKTKDIAYKVDAGVGNNLKLKKVNNVSHYIGQQIHFDTIGTTLKEAVGDFPTAGSGNNIKISMKGNTIKISQNDVTLIEYTDPDPIKQGGIGLWAGCTVLYDEVKIAYDRTIHKTLVQATTDVNWRDDAHRFIIHSTDEVPQELQPGHDSELTELISYLNSGNIFLFNLGIDAVNKDEFNRLDEALIDAQGNPRSKYLRNYPIKERMLQAAQEIIDMLKQFQTESEWILVDSDINWTVVEWADFEQDVPLNFGEHDGTGRYGDIDKQVSLDWGVSLTHLWTQPKILAERWRFRHFEDYFDNNLGKVNYNGAWIEDAPTSFSKTGKYRINYQRKDNPFHTDVSLSNVFDMYRKWSTNYNDN